MKNQRGRKTVWKLFLICFFTLLIQKGVYAADFNATVSSATAEQGKEVTITVTFSSNVNIGAYAMRLTYDSSILEYSSGADGGGGGTLQFYNDYVNSTSKSYTITFQTKAAGTSSLSLDAISVPCDAEANDMTVKSSNGSVTVSAPVEASSNNNLAALNVAFVYSDGRTESAALSPAFSADTTSYNLTAGEDVTRLSLDVTAADGKAAVQVSGTRMDPGSNTTTITVTAENGAVKKYVIYTEKAQPSTTEPEPTTPPEPTTEPEPTTPPEPTENPSENIPVTVDIGGKNYTVQNIPEDAVLPEGYEVVPIDYKGTQFTALQGLSTNLILLYLVDGESETGDFYIYDKEKDSYTLFVSLTIRQHMYTVLDIPENIALPYNGEIGRDYLLETLEINGVSVQALSYGVQDLYLVYAMNWNGESGLYFYDSKEESMLRYAYSELENKKEETPAAVVPADTSISQKERKEWEKRIDKRNILIIVLVLLIVVLGGTLFLLFTVNKKRKHTGKKRQSSNLGEEYEGYEEYETEEEEPMDEESLNQALDDILKGK